MTVRLMGETLLRSAALHPDKEALVSGGDRLTYGQLLESARSFAAAFQEAGLERGGRVAIYLENGARLVSALYGAWLAGGVPVVMNPQTKPDKLAFMLDDCQAAVLVSDDMLARFHGPALEALSAPPVLISGSPDPDGVPAPVPVIPTDLAALIYTSGSTGNPKGVMLTHQNMVFTCGSLVEYLRLGADDRILNVLPLAFDYGLYQVLMAVYLGATCVLEAGFSYPVKVLETAGQEKVTVFPGVPTVFATLVSMQKREPRSLPHVTRVTNTAAHLPDDFVPALRGLFPSALIYKMYGLTECKRVSYLPPEMIDTKPGSVGVAIPGTEVYLLDEDGSPVKPGRTGVLYVRGPHVMAGYLNQPELTAHMLKPGPVPGERVLCTHDYFRQDEDGYLYFEGRSDDIIKTRGEKVSPVEVENALHAIPGVREAAVIGAPDELLGEVVVAYVVREQDSGLDERQLKRQAMGRLESFMVPSVVHFISEMPKTPTGKVRKKDLSEPVA